MKIIVVTSQQEFDALPLSFDEDTRIEITANQRVTVSVDRSNGHVVARESSHVEAWESSHVEARGSSHVVARGSSHVEAWESSHVKAWGSSHVVARESSHVEAWGSSHVEAWELSHVEAWESSHVEAWGSSFIRALSPEAEIYAYGSSMVSLEAGAKVITTSPRSTVIMPERYKDTFQWIEDNGVSLENDTAILYKRVSVDFRTQEGAQWETHWEIGKTLTHPNWDPTSEECYGGKFHACPKPYLCNKFRSREGDRYVAIAIQTVDLHAWTKDPQYPEKIAFRKGTVLYEVDRYGNRLQESENRTNE